MKKYKQGANMICKQAAYLLKSMLFFFSLDLFAKAHSQKKEKKKHISRLKILQSNSVNLTSIGDTLSTWISCSRNFECCVFLFVNWKWRFSGRMNFQGKKSYKSSYFIINPERNFLWSKNKWITRVLESEQINRRVDELNAACKAITSTHPMVKTRETNS